MKRSLIFPLSLLTFSIIGSGSSFIHVASYDKSSSYAPKEWSTQTVYKDPVRAPQTWMDQKVAQRIEQSEVKLLKEPQNAIESIVARIKEIEQKKKSASWNHMNVSDQIMMDKELATLQKLFNADGGKELWNLMLNFDKESALQLQKDLQNRCASPAIVGAISGMISKGFAFKNHPSIIEGLARPFGFSEGPHASIIAFKPEPLLEPMRMTAPTYNHAKDMANVEKALQNLDWSKESEVERFLEYMNAEIQDTFVARKASRAVRKIYENLKANETLDVAKDVSQFIWNASVGKLYLSTEEYNKRVEGGAELVNNVSSLVVNDPEKLFDLVLDASIDYATKFGSVTNKNFSQAIKESKRVGALAETIKKSAKTIKESNAS